MRSTLWAIVTAALILAVLTTTTGSSLAQTTSRLEELQVDLWPEFDQPDMLVIYRGKLPENAPLPATLTLRLPAQVEEPHAVAYDDGAGSLFQAPYSTSVTDQGLSVTLETPTPSFQLEFYDRLSRTDDRRSYTFVWPGDYAVGQLDLLLLPPPGATDIETEPSMSTLQRNSGSSGYFVSLGSLANGQEAQIRVSYRRTTTDVGVVTPLPSDEGSSSTILIGGSILAAILLVIGAGLWYTRRLRPQPTKTMPERRPKSRRGQSIAATTQRARTSARYCAHCGRPLQADDRFCSQCGTPVKGQRGAPE